MGAGAVAAGVVALLAITSRAPVVAAQSAAFTIACSALASGQIGSNQSVAPQTQGNTTRSSQKLVERRSSMSAFQVSSTRGSGLDITGSQARVAAPTSSRSYLIIAVILLALAAASLAVLLMVM